MYKKCYKISVIRFNIKNSLLNITQLFSFLRIRHLANVDLSYFPQMENITHLGFEPM